MKLKTTFSAADVRQIADHGLSVADIENQMDCFRRGFSPTKLTEAATVKNGLISYSKIEEKLLVEEFDECASDYIIAKFVPASGAATRMFRDLYAAVETLNNNEGISAVVEKFLKHLKEFAFYGDLKDLMKKNGVDIEKSLSQKGYLQILKTILDADGLNFGTKPKAFIPFHDYGKFARTALEEQIHEGLAHAVGSNNTLNVHFTISPEHEKEFKALTKSVLAGIQSEVNIKITHSFQQKNTDTIAVDMKDVPVRDKWGQLVFRPGGHGALLQNLNDIKAEMVFLKNIDNIVPDNHRSDTIWYKKILGGSLMQLVNEIHAFLIMLDNGNVEDSDLNEMLAFAEERLYATVPAWLRESDSLEKMDFLFEFFNRPVRVCGMVKNEDEPGGGPFFVEDSYGMVSLQIVESSQVDIKDEKQKKILSSSTHFNPVDLVCWKNNYCGEPFNLLEFSNSETGFIATKSLEGKDVKAMELPGLWNGAMANWITLFVEVPLSTFNPVKEINDLLRERHK